MDSVAKKQSILITGGAGGVGHVAIQLALIAQAKVYTTASNDGTRFLKDFGELNLLITKPKDFMKFCWMLMLF